MTLNFTSRTIAVIGDLILDKYIRGTALKLSPEAPVPVVHINAASVSHNLGGAGNVASNIKSLGGEPVLIGVVGSDDDAFEVQRLLKQFGMISHGVLHSIERPTTIKTRLIANGHQIARMDRETVIPIDAEVEKTIFNYVNHIIDDVAAIIISDYAKGVVTYNLVCEIAALALEHNVPVFVDPKTSHRDYYRTHGITTMTPNIHEATDLINNTSTEVNATGRYILKYYGHEFCLITQGEAGMVLFDSHQAILGQWKEPSSYYLPTTAKHVFDVSGAGDTVIAALTLAYASRYSMLKSAKIANAAAGIVVSKPGTAVCTKRELEESIDEIE